MTVYGDVPPVGSRKNIGVCGVCRQPMRISDGGERKKGGGSQSTPLRTVSITDQSRICHAYRTGSIVAPCSLSERLEWIRLAITKAKC